MSATHISLIGAIVQRSPHKTPGDAPYPSLTVYVAQVRTIDNSIVFLRLAYNTPYHVPRTSYRSSKSTSTDLALITYHSSDTAYMIVCSEVGRHHLHIPYAPVQH